MAGRIRGCVDAHRKKRLDLRRSPKRVPVVGDVERLDAVRVAGEQHAPAVRVVEREGIHPAQVVGHPLPLIAVEREQNLGVGARAEDVAAAFEAVAERAEVVDLAVERDVQPPVVARHRLCAGVGEVEDGEAPVAEPGGAVVARPHALAVWAAHGHLRARPRERRGKPVGIGAVGDRSSYSTHVDRGGQGRRTLADGRI